METLAFQQAIETREIEDKFNVSNVKGCERRKVLCEERKVNFNCCILKLNVVFVCQILFAV